jgi:hypothetical protein
MVQEGNTGIVLVCTALVLILAPNLTDYTTSLSTP